MYGTIARLRLKPGKEAALQELSREEQGLKIPGWLFEYAYRMDADQREYFLVVGFESRDAYVANANSPEQHERYVRFRELLESDPEWHDGEIAYSHQP